MEGNVTILGQVLPETKEEERRGTKTGRGAEAERRRKRKRGRRKKRRIRKITVVVRLLGGDMAPFLKPICLQKIKNFTLGSLKSGKSIQREFQKTKAKKSLRGLLKIITQRHCLMKSIIT
jgi:hypothetical protein